MERNMIRALLVGVLMVFMLPAMFACSNVPSDPASDGSTSETEESQSTTTVPSTTQTESAVSDSVMSGVSSTAVTTGAMTSTSTNTTSKTSVTTTATSKTTRPRVTLATNAGDTTTKPLAWIDVTLPDAYKKADVEYVCDDESVLYTYNNKAKKDFDAAVAYYKSKGYQEYSSTARGENYAATYVYNNAMAHMYWCADTKELNIVTSARAGKTLPPAKPKVTSGDFECKVAQMYSTMYNGMSYAVLLEDGSYIVFDGGYDGGQYNIVHFIDRNNETADKPIIRAWVLTHSHNDHYPAFTAFARDNYMNSKYIVENVIISPLNDKNYVLNNESYDPYLSDEFYNDAESIGATVVFAHTGMKFKFCNLNMEILFTPETLWKTRSTVADYDFNDTSIVARLYDDDYSALFLADAGVDSKTWMEKTYGDYLKSDMCQMAHHGVDQGPVSFYDKVKPQILFYPTTDAFYKEPGWCPAVRRAMETKEYVKEILIHNLAEFERAWGTRYAEDAPLLMPNYKAPTN